MSNELIENKIILLNAVVKLKNKAFLTFPEEKFSFAILESIDDIVDSIESDKDYLKIDSLRIDKILNQ